MDPDDFTDRADDAIDLIGIARDRLVNEENLVGFDGAANPDAIFEEILREIFFINGTQYGSRSLNVESREVRLSICRDMIVLGGLVNLMIEATMFDDDDEPFSQLDLVGVDGTAGEV